MLFGWLLPGAAQQLAVLGTIYVSLLKTLMLPLLFASIVSAVLRLETTARFRKSGARALGFYLLTSSLAAAMGISLALLLQPAGEVLAYSGEPMGEGGFSMELLVAKILPDNPFAALTSGNALAVISFALLFAVALLSLPKERQKPVAGVVESLDEALLTLAGFVIKLTPVGAFALLANLTATSDPALFADIGGFVLLSFLAIAIHGLITLPLVAAFLGRFHPYRYLFAVREALMVALATASSSATLPVSLRVAEEKGSVRRKTAGFVLPLGATINMDGSAFYQPMVILFTAHLAGLSLEPDALALLFFAAILSSVGTAGIPGGGIMMVALLMESVGVPPELLGVVIAADRLLDMFITAVNVWGDLIAAKTLDRKETYSNEGSPEPAPSR